GHGLADDHRAGGAQPRHHGRVPPRPAPGGERGAELGREIGGVDDVLDRDRDAVERTERTTLRAALVEGARLTERGVAIEMGEGADLAVPRVDAIEAGADILLRRERAAGDLRGGFGRGQGRVVGQTVLSHSNRIAVRFIRNVSFGHWAAEGRRPHSRRVLEGKLTPDDIGVRVILTRIGSSYHFPLSMTFSALPTSSFPIFSAHLP